MCGFISPSTGDVLGTVQITVLIAVVEMQPLEAEFLHMAHVGILWWDRADGDEHRYMIAHEHLALHRVRQFLLCYAAMLLCCLTIFVHD